MTCELVEQLIHSTVLPKDSQEVDGMCCLLLFDSFITLTEVKPISEAKLSYGEFQKAYKERGTAKRSEELKRIDDAMHTLFPHLRPGQEEKVIKTF